MKTKADHELFQFSPGSGMNGPVLIAGPCSAESEEQLLNTAKALKKLNVHLFRAGIWKPRTIPGGFQGAGSKALTWLQRVKEETGLPVATEVATEKHVRQVLEHGIDAVWVGARTTANPFAVEEIAQALKGTTMPVMVKNPINPDIKLWEGAIERLYSKGIHLLAAIHRGFSTIDNSPYRYPPLWNIPQKLKHKFPHLPVFSDPSHICGNRALLHKISRHALQTSFSGLMLEVHPNPDQALTDSKQQITPEELKSMLDKLVLRNEELDKEQQATIEELRVQIDKYDDMVLDTFQKRMEVAEKIGRYKKENNITILQTKRWDEILNKRIKQGEMKNLSPNFITKIFRAIHQESINHQEKIMSQVEKEMQERESRNN